MAIARLSWGGAITDTNNGGTDIEEWSNTVYIGIPAAPGQPQADSVAAHISDWHTGVGPDFSGGSRSDKTVRLDWLKFNAIDPITGHQISPVTIRHDFTPGVYGTASFVSAGLHAPTSSAVRVTIDDGTRNRRHKGGFFIPRPGFTCGSNGRIDPVVTAGLATDAAFLLAWPWYTGALQTLVYSRVNESATTCTRLRIGNVIDNISRRRNDLKEVYDVRPI